MYLRYFVGSIGKPLEKNYGFWKNKNTFELGNEKPDLYDLFKKDRSLQLLPKHSGTILNKFVLIIYEYNMYSKQNDFSIIESCDWWWNK